MDNLNIYNAVRAVPPAALKEIQAGRLKGKSDINPMWRIKTLTEQFGICGIGWKYEIKEKRLEKGGGEEIAAFVDINLYVKVNSEWSEAIPGTGGSSFVANERNGLYTSDECFKMALTDAISVACKALGVGADVYWDKDKTKYSQPAQKETTAPAKADPPAPTKVYTAKMLVETIRELGWSDADARAFIEQNTGKKGTKDLTKEDLSKLFTLLDEQRKAVEEAMKAGATSA